VEPEHVQALHNLCVVEVERGRLDQAEQCLTKAAALAPHEEYIRKHLNIVRGKLRKQRKKQT
jgi:Flp pilus assembly protein TadD